LTHQAVAPSAAKQAVVIGGSLGGLFAGLLLRSIGWDVDIYERWPRAAVEGEEVRFAHDSLLEESGFEPSVPLGEKRSSFRNASIRELHRAAYRGGHKRYRRGRPSGSRFPGSLSAVSPDACRVSDPDWGDECCLGRRRP
jgi:hypothetical protein